MSLQLRADSQKERLSSLREGVRGAARTLVKVVRDELMDVRRGV